VPSGPRIALPSDHACSDEPMYEDEDVGEDFYDGELPEDEENAGDDEDPEADNIIHSNDPSAAANHGKGNDKSHRDKKIPDAERTTTPYMTKYEKARILGTRALQIRCVPSTPPCSLFLRVGLDSRGKRLTRPITV